MLTPSGYSVGHTSLQDRCDSYLADCTYAWLGIPNRAFALLATNPTTSLKLERAALLYFETLRSGNKVFHMQAADRFVDLRRKVLSACGAAVRGQETVIRSVDVSDCEAVAAAFDAVGVYNTTSTGFDRYAIEFDASSNLEQTDRAGVRFHNGCLISGQAMNLEFTRVVDGKFIRTLLSRDDLEIPPLTVFAPNVSANTHDAEISAWVTERCGGDAARCVDPQNRQVRYKVKSKWHGPIRAWVSEQRFQPAGANCESATPGARPAYFQSSPIVHTRAAAMFGKREDHSILPNYSSGFFMTDVCELSNIGGIDEHRTPAPSVLSFASSFTHNAHGFSVTRTGDLSNNFDYSANLHTWVDGFQFMFARVVYELQEPPGGHANSRAWYGSPREPEVDSRLSLGPRRLFSAV